MKAAFSADSGADRVCIVCCNGNPAGVLPGTGGGQGILQALLDYSKSPVGRSHQKWEEKQTENRQTQTIFRPDGSGDTTRTCDLLLPNGWTKFFAPIYSRFRCALLGIGYSLTVLYPLFPRAPALGVVKYVVRKHFSARPGSR